MNPSGALQDEPAEHLRFAAYLREFAQVTDAEETALVRKVLNDPDQAMAQSAVLRHLDHRAAALYPGAAFELWAEAMTQATERHPFLTRRLQEWSLLRAITLGLPWHPRALLESSDWLQRKIAATSYSEALQHLAENGRTKRIRNTARASLQRPGRH